MDTGPRILFRGPLALAKKYMSLEAPAYTFPGNQADASRSVWNSDLATRSWNAVRRFSLPLVLHPLVDFPGVLENSTELQ